MKMYKPAGRTNCISKCVPPNQVERYVSNGWWYWCLSGGYAFFAKATGKKIPNKPLEKTPSDNAIVSNNIFRLSKGVIKRSI
jgi:hypothetical protein